MNGKLQYQIVDANIQADKDFTDKMMKVGKLLNINRCGGLPTSRFGVTDHQIITETGYYSFAERGLIKELVKSGLYEVTHKESEEMKAWREEELGKRAADDKARQIALRSIELGLSVDNIVKITGLRKVSVEKMRRELGK